MKKKPIVLVIILLLVCCSLSFALYSVKYSHASTCNTPLTETKSNNNSYDGSSFDVSDFSGSNENTIDIASKQYDSNVVTVRDSNYTISDELMNKINDNISSYGAGVSFYIVSLDDGMSIGYNVDKAFETASSIKAPYALWIYEQIAEGNIDPDATFEYEEKYYNKGTGVIKDSDFGTPYTVRDLVYYSLNDSDNVAHVMLHKNFGVIGYNNMLANLGTKQLYLTAGNPWTYTSCRSAALVWQEIYNFAVREPEGVTFLNILSNGKYNYFKELMPDVPSASKTGFANRDVVETGIVFDQDKPYIAIAMANKGGSIGAYTEVLKVISLMNEVMNEYKAQ